MKALSIKQPWASLIALGIKDIENRTWKTHFRGRIYIHSSAKGVPNFDFNQQQTEALENVDTENMNMPYSAIIGEVDIIDCVINHLSIWAENVMSSETEKLIYNWVLANPIIYDKPILNVKGKLSFWFPDNDIIQCIGCGDKFDSEFMESDDAGDKYCKDCEIELFPIMQKEYDEMKANGEII